MLPVQVLPVPHTKQFVFKVEAAERCCCPNLCALSALLKGCMGIGREKKPCKSKELHVLTSGHPGWHWSCDRTVLPAHSNGTIQWKPLLELWGSWPKAQLLGRNMGFLVSCSAKWFASAYSSTPTLAVLFYCYKNVSMTASDEFQKFQHII